MPSSSWSLSARRVAAPDTIAALAAKQRWPGPPQAKAKQRLLPCFLQLLAVACKLVFQALDAAGTYRLARAASQENNDLDFEDPTPTPRCAVRPSRPPRPENVSQAVFGFASSSAHVFWVSSSQIAGNAGNGRSAAGSLRSPESVRHPLKNLSAGD